MVETNKNIPDPYLETESFADLTTGTGQYANLAQSADEKASELTQPKIKSIPVDEQSDLEGVTLVGDDGQW